MFLQTTQLHSSQALSDIDYRSAQNQFTFINDSMESAFLPIYIIPDDLPELDEVFRIVLTHVELVGGGPDNIRNKPAIGDMSMAAVTIEANDDANGVFRIYSNDPRALDGGRLIEVEERDNFAVELVIERGGRKVQQKYFCHVK